MRAKIEELTASKRFDVAVLSGKQTLPAVRTLRGVPVVADVCDAASVRIRGQLACAELRQTPGLFGSYLRMRRIEQRLMRRASSLVFASCRDRDSLRPDAGQNAAVVPNGVDLDYWQRTTQLRETNKIVFTGAMHYSPNADAAKYLIRHIMPCVRKAIPDAELTIVGRDPRPDLLAAAAGQTGVIVTGFVEDVRPYLERATVFAAPLRFGAGIQNKVLEAMAMGVQVVASPVAADGLRTEDGWTPPIEVAEKKEAFAQAILRELRLAELHPEPSTLTREYVQSHFDWPEAVDKLERVLFRATTRRTRTIEPNTRTLATVGEPVAAGES
jgi:glycosyltransferase involved in cell wall biosynthesis